jgi:hypothetical protein
MCFVDLILLQISIEGAWMPEAKEMMPFWWYFQPSFNCPYEIERVGRFNDGGKVCCLPHLFLADLFYFPFFENEGDE